MFDAKLTLLCAVRGGYVRTVLTGAHWEQGAGALPAQTGGVSTLAAQRRALALLPFASAQGYCPPAAWTGTNGGWTLRPGDVLLCGAWQPAEDAALVTAAQAEALLASGAVYVIASVEEVGRGMPTGHFAVWAGRAFGTGGAA